MIIMKTRAYIKILHSYSVSPLKMSWVLTRSEAKVSFYFIFYLFLYNRDMTLHIVSFLCQHY